jgi:hypothetical protein
MVKFSGCKGRIEPQHNHTQGWQELASKSDIGALGAPRIEAAFGTPKHIEIEE